MYGMLKTVVKNVFSKPATRLYPFVKREPFENARGNLVMDAQACTLCKICDIMCPSDCINIDKEAGYWELDPYNCVVCGVCVDACPKKCLSLEAAHRTAGEKVLYRHFPPVENYQRKKKVETAAEAAPAAPAAEAAPAAPAEGAAE